MQLFEEMKRFETETKYLMHTFEKMTMVGVWQWFLFLGFTLRLVQFYGWKRPLTIKIDKIVTFMDIDWDRLSIFYHTVSYKGFNPFSMFRLLIIHVITRYNRFQRKVIWWGPEAIVIRKLMKVNELTEL